MAPEALRANSSRCCSIRTDLAGATTAARINTFATAQRTDRLRQPNGEALPSLGVQASAEEGDAHDSQRSQETWVQAVQGLRPIQRA